MGPSQDGWNVHRLNEHQMQDMVEELVPKQETLHEDVLQRAAAERPRSLEAI